METTFPLFAFVFSNTDMAHSTMLQALLIECSELLGSILFFVKSQASRFHMIKRWFNETQIHFLGTSQLYPFRLYATDTLCRNEAFIFPDSMSYAHNPDRVKVIRVCTVETLLFRYMVRQVVISSSFRIP